MSAPRGAPRDSGASSPSLPNVNEVTGSQEGYWSLAQSSAVLLGGKKRGLSDHHVFR